MAINPDRFLLRATMMHAIADTRPTNATTQPITSVIKWTEVTLMGFGGNWNSESKREKYTKTMIQKFLIEDLRMLTLVLWVNVIVQERNGWRNGATV